MSSLAISGIVFACIFGGALLGILLRARLPEGHLSADSKEVVKLIMGILGTMAALVLGLLVATTKGSFDSQSNGVAQLAANVITLDRVLAHYGKEAQPLREQLRTSVADMIQRTWPEEDPESGQPAAKSGTEGRYEELYERVLALEPKTEAQHTLQAQALKIGGDTMQMRWLLFAQRGGSIPTPFLVVMVCWLALIFASFGLFTPRNATTLTALFLGALAISSTIFLILELSHPFSGTIRVSSEPLRNALALLGR